MSKKQLLAGPATAATRPVAIRRLTLAAFAQAVDTLARGDARLGKIIARRGSPPFWRRPPGFETLVLMILEQQVSLRSARAVFDRLQTLVSPLTPIRLLRAGEETRRQAGITRQKFRYCHELAHAIEDSRLNLRTLSRRDDGGVRMALTRITGIGLWTADVYLLMAMRRADIWPTGDRALALALRDLNRLTEVPAQDQIEQFGQRWRPYRSVAARILWHEYLCARGRA